MIVCKIGWLLELWDEIEYERGLMNKVDVPVNEQI